MNGPRPTGGGGSTALARAACAAGTCLVVLVLAGCALAPQTTHGPTAAPGGLSRDAAISLALQEAPAFGPAPTVVWASIEPNPFDRSGNPLVWIVRLQGGLAASPCPSGFLDRAPSVSDAICLDGDGGVDVVLDHFSGDLLGWVH